MSDQSLQRASDADREAVINVLQEAAADGRLDLVEFDERMAATYQAKTFGELEVVTRDLRGVSDAPVPSGHKSEVVISAVGSSTKRKGSWVVPRRVVVNGKFGSTKLDLTEAKILSRDVEIVLDSSAGSVVIIVPEGTAVDANELVTNFGSASVRVHGTHDAPLRLKVTGQSNMGSVVIRRLGFFERWFRSLRKR